MATYKYLETGTAFNASELNLRFDAVIGTNKGLNAIKLEDCSLGAFRHNMLPRLIHSSTFTTMPPSRDFGSEVNVGFSTTTSTSTIIEQEFSEPLSLDMNGGDNLSSVIVLANVCVEKFDTKLEIVQDGETIDKLKPNEDVNHAEFFIEIETTGAADPIVLDRTVRALSPRVTIDSSNNFCIGFDGVDLDTSQDVSIRTVITVDDLDSPTSKLTLVRLRKRKPTTLDKAVRTQVVTYSKRNLTTIPLHAKVTSGG
jgi:hypothetical protein